MNERLIGYCRVSSRGQNECRQVHAMREFGIPEKDIFVEKMSGKNFNRPVYQEIVKLLKPKDIFVIKSLDRLGRNYDTVIDEWRFLTKEKGVIIVVLDMPLLDLRQRGNDLTLNFIADIVLQILSYCGNLERDFIRLRQAEGIAAAKSRGVKFGNQPKKRPSGLDKIYEKWKSGEISAREAGRQLGVSHTTFLRWTKDL